MHFINVIIVRLSSFSGSLPFSGLALLNWFTKSSKFEEDFNDNELL